MLRSIWPALLAAVALTTVGCAHCKKCSKFPNPGLAEPGCAPSGMPTAAMIGEPMPATETYMVAPPSGPPVSGAPSPFTVPATQSGPAPVAAATPAPAPPAGGRTPARGVTGAGPVGGSVARPAPATPAASQPDPLPLSAPPISPPSP